MKRPTSKVFLTPDLSLPRDNPCRFHLGGTALAPSPCISNNRSRGIPTENVPEEKIHTKWEEGTSLSQGEKGIQT